MTTCTEEVSAVVNAVGEQIEIDFLLVADRAEGINGKLYMMGGAWDRLTVANFEQRNMFSLAIGVLIPWNETNEEHTIRIFLEHEDGKVIQPEIQGQVSTGRPPNAIKGQSFRVIVAVNGAWKLPGPGTYRAVATMGDGITKRAVFYAIPADKASAA
jgi:hypothetical protein